MSRIIADILGLKQPQFQHLIEVWETKSGRRGNDVRLVSDIRIRGVQAARALGVEDGSPARELYFMLEQQVDRHNERLTQLIGVKETDTPRQLLKKTISWAEKQQIYTDVWVLKSAFVKDLLKKQPPRMLMKALGLRSIDSMLKRNSPSELLPLAFLLEKPEWSHKFRQRFKKLSAQDFQASSISLHILTKERVEKLTKAHFPASQIVTPCYELGSLVVTPPKERFQGDVIAVAVALVESIAETRRHSAYFRAMGVHKDFGPRFAEVSEHGLVGASSRLSHVGWSSLHKHLIGNEEFFARVEQPHFAYEDVHAPSAVQVLAAADPAFGFWEGLEYVFFMAPNEKPVSMHLIDVVTNRSNRFDLSQSTISYGQARLWDELWSRYLSSDEIADEIAEKFLGMDDA